MFKHHLSSALRHFRRHRLTTAINIACLTIGLVCFLAIYATVAYMSHGDRHYANADRIYMVTQKIGTAITAPTPAWVTAKYLRTDVPELETVARITASIGVIAGEAPITAGERKTILSVSYADPDFLHVFALPFLAGDSREALRQPRSAVISKNTAIQLYGNVSDALGKPLRLQDGSAITVRGVIDELLQPSHLSTNSAASSALVRFDILLSMDVLEAEAAVDFMKRSAISDRPTASPIFATYAVLPKDGSFTIADLRARLRKFGPMHADSDTVKHHFDAMNVSDYQLDMLSSISSADKTGVSANALFYFLGAVVLLVSCLNYANLATAQAATRAKEIGMRRVVGAHRRQLMLQFFIEAGVTSLAALMLALLITVAVLFLMRSVSITLVVASVAATLPFWSMLGALLIMVTICAGAYPALVLSRVRPQQAMRKASSKSGGRFTQRVLVAIQFSAASFLVIAILAMQAQNAEFRRLASSSAADPFVVFSNNIRAAGVDYEVLRTQLLRQPHIQSVTASLLSPWVITTGSKSFATSPEAGARRARAGLITINQDFFATLGIDLLAGRVFDRAHANDDASAGDSSSMGNVVIDRLVAQQNGWAVPGEAIGQVIYELNQSEGVAPMPRRVIGVVENRPMGMLNLGSSANIYVLASAPASTPIVRVSKTDTAAALAEISQVWNELAPQVALKTRLASDIVGFQLQIFDSIGRVFGGVALLAFFISLLGLIGMSMHVIGRRSHEIGVRKTLGASVRGIVVMLLKDFSAPVLIANLIAWPAAFLIMKIYLSIFTQRTGLTAAPFIASLALTLMIAWIAVIAQATRAARLNPAVALRYE